MKVSLLCITRCSPWPYNPGEVFGVEPDEVAEFIRTGCFVANDAPGAGEQTGAGEQGEAQGQDAGEQGEAQGQDAGENDGGGEEEGEEGEPDEADGEEATALPVADRRQKRSKRR